MIGTCKEVNYILHRKFRRKNSNVGKWTFARQLETSPKSPQDKSEYTNMYTRRVGVYECRRKNAQDNYKFLIYGHNPSSRQLSCCPPIHVRYLQRGSTNDLVYTACHKNEHEKRSRDRELAKKNSSRATSSGASLRLSVYV